MARMAWCCPIALVLTVVMSVPQALAQTPPAETTSGSVPTVGAYSVRPGDTLSHIARRLGVTVEQLKLANGRTTDALTDGEMLRVVRELPAVRVDLGSLKLTLTYEGRVVASYPVGVGAGTLTPTGSFTVGTRLKDPVWWRDGQRIPFGDPRNIIGTRWMTLNKPDGERTSYGIHGTSEPDSVPGRTSAGCVRMLNADVEELFEWTPAGTTVVIARDTPAAGEPAAETTAAAEPAGNANRVAYVVHVRTFPNTADGKRSLSEDLVFLRMQNVPNLLTLPAAGGQYTSLYAGAFTVHERGAAAALAARLQAMTVRGEKPYAAAKVVLLEGGTPSSGGATETVQLIDNGRAMVPTVPGGAPVVTFTYTLSARTDAAGRAKLDALVDPLRKDLRPLIRKLVDAVLLDEDFVKLRTGDLSRPRRRIRTILNTLADADVVSDVVFADWKVAP